MSTTVQILLGMILGIVTGLFLGEFAAPFSIAGDIFIGLLQMTVLPYIVVSLIGNLGRITWSRSKRLITAAISVLAALLALGVIVLITVPIAFPKWQSAAFFSSSLVQAPQIIDLVKLYIPANPFNALANNIVPAAVLFSILLGIGVSGLKGNEGLLQALNVLADALNRINKMVIPLTPVGVFAIAAGTAGTAIVEEISRLQVYLITYTVVAVILTFIVLPLLISACTPFRYRDLLSIPGDTLITIFATAKIIVVLPQLMENVRELFRRYQLDDEETDSAAGILLPLAYPFPNLGTYAILMFVPFCTWYLGHSLDLPEQFAFQASALLSSFVAPIIGIPFLLDLLEIPADLMELFIMSTVYTDRVRVVLGAMHLLALSIIAISINRGIFKLNPAALLRAGAISLLAIVASLLVLRAWFGFAINADYSGDQALVQMRWMNRPVSATLYNETLPEPQLDAAEIGRLGIIAARGTLRVGYLPDSLPFAFRNERGRVVGFDVEMAHHLASDLDVKLELVRTEQASFSDLFQSGQIDIVMSGLAKTPDRLRQWNFSASPMDITLGFLVPDYRRNAFRTRQSVLQISGLKLGIVQSDLAFKRDAALRFPNAEFTQIPSPRKFLRGEQTELDAVVYSAEGGAAWTLIYPEFSVVVPHPLATKVPLGYPLPQHDPAWSRFVAEWIHLKQKNGTVAALFKHWIQGGGAQATEPRWSIIRNELHWVD